jgi:peroxiredoxin
MRCAACILAVTCLLISSCVSTDNPVAGRSYTLRYDPSVAGILSDATTISVVYAFDYWGTKAVQKLRGEGPQEDLFQNVLEPSLGRAFQAKMSHSGSLWEAQIDIPQSAKLLSYFFTDGSRNDYNNRHTYVSFVYDHSGKPVRGARFRNVDFLIMAGEGLPAILSNLREEMEQYPDDYLAHLVYWRFRFFDTDSPDTLRMLMVEAKGHYAKLREQLGDTVLNFFVRNLNDINRVIELSLSSRYDEPSVAQLRKDINTDVINLVDGMPREKRSLEVMQLALAARQTLAGRDPLREFVGQPAPDFAFVTTDGTSHRLSDFHGSFVLLDFWGSWCSPCVGEIPFLVQMHERFHKSGLVMISVTNDASVNKWTTRDLTEYAHKKAMRWMQVLDDKSGSIHKLFKVSSWPNPFLINKEGKVVQRRGLRGEQLGKTISDVLAK